MIMGVFVNYCAGVSRGILPAVRVDAILVNVPQQAAHKAAVRGASFSDPLDGVVGTVTSSKWFLCTWHIAEKMETGYGTITNLDVQNEIFHNHIFSVCH